MQTEILPLKQRRAQEKALALLAAEQIIVAPTDTVYGLMGRFDSVTALERIYIAKGRPPYKGIITLIGHLDQLGRCWHSLGHLDQLSRLVVALGCTLSRCDPLHL